MAKGHAWKACKAERPRGFESRFLRHKKVFKFAVLDGKVAVSCNLQPAVAGLNPSLRYIVCSAGLCKW